MYDNDVIHNDVIHSFFAFLTGLELRLGCIHVPGRPRSRVRVLVKVLGWFDNFSARDGIGYVYHI